MHINNTKAAQIHNGPARRSAMKSPTVTTPRPNLITNRTQGSGYQATARKWPSLTHCVWHNNENFTLPQTMPATHRPFSPISRRSSDICPNRNRIVIHTPRGPTTRPCHDTSIRHRYNGDQMRYRHTTARSLRPSTIFYERVRYQGAAGPDANVTNWRARVVWRAAVRHMRGRRLAFTRLNLTMQREWKTVVAAEARGACEGAGQWSRDVWVCKHWSRVADHGGVKGGGSW